MGQVDVKSSIHQFPFAYDEKAILIDFVLISIDGSFFNFINLFISYLRKFILFYNQKDKPKSNKKLQKQKILDLQNSNIKQKDLNKKERKKDRFGQDQSSFFSIEMHLPQKYIQDAIHNPLLFQQNNPLISQSMSLLNSRHKKSGDNSNELQQFTSKQLSARLRKKCDAQNKSKSRQSSNGDYEESSKGHFEDQDDDEIENIRAIKQFERQIEEKFKISVANKIYTFPKLKITSIMDIISSSQEQDDQSEDYHSKQTSQLTDRQFNPFNEKYYQKRFKTQNAEGKSKSKEKMNKGLEDRNFKKVKISEKKDKEKKNSSLKKEKEEMQRYDHQQKPKLIKKNPEVTGTSKETQKTKNQTQKIEKYSQKSNQKNQKPWIVRQSHSKKQNYIERLKTQMDNRSSGRSQSITQSKKRFYEEEFFIKR